MLYFNEFQKVVLDTRHRQEEQAVSHNAFRIYGPYVTELAIAGSVTGCNVATAIKYLYYT